MARSPERQIREFLTKYSPPIAKELRAARARLRKLFPRGHELVYDNYNALVFGFSPTERASDAVISVAGYPRWVTLFFLHGVGLKDPRGLLQGSGSRVRNVRLESSAQLGDPLVRALLAQAINPHREAFRRGPALQTTIKSVSKKQRPRRAASAKARST
jgi:hypothetical protein